MIGDGAAIATAATRKHLNAAISEGKPGRRRRGVMFPDRYHAEIITSPRQARHALSYVLNNWRKHRDHLRVPMSGWPIDWFSSAAMFPGWAEYGDAAFCGATLRATTRSSCTSQEPGCCGRAGREPGRSPAARFRPRR